jgi:Ribbon-helix-helix protein, copG family
MAKKKAVTPKGKTMPVAAQPIKGPDVGHARIELDRPDFERLRRLARARGLSISAYVRQAVLLALKAEEGGKN